MKLLSIFNLHTNHAVGKKCHPIIQLSRWLLIITGIVIITTACSTERELGVYTLCSYENGWKSNVCLSSLYDPYETFWDNMTSSTGHPYADADDSRRYKNQEVTIKTILPIPGDDLKGWDEFDLVFFYGHNNMIVPPHPDHNFGYDLYESGIWNHYYELLSTIDWGHTTPYDYYTFRGITSGDTHPGAVIYLYHEYTSALLGGLYHYGQGSGMQWRVRWNDPVEYAPHGTKAWQLGANDLEWLILHGCQSVIVANEDGTVYNPMGINCFHWTQGGFHIVLGHYRSFYSSDFLPLHQMAFDLRIGVTVQEAYFDVDPDNNTSAIAAEKNPFPGWSNSTMETDKWSDPVSDIKDASVFSQKWISYAGNELTHVN